MPLYVSRRWLSKLIPENKSYKKTVFLTWEVFQVRAASFVSKEQRNPKSPINPVAIHPRGPGPPGGKAEQEPAPGLPPPSDAPTTSEATLTPSLSLRHKPSSTSKHGENIFGMIQFYKREFMFPIQLRLKVMQKTTGPLPSYLEFLLLSLH